MMKSKMDLSSKDKHGKKEELQLEALEIRALEEAWG